MSAEEVKAFAYVAMSGEQVRGTPGVAWVDSSEGRAIYLLINEVHPEKLREDLRGMIENDEDQHYFILHKEENNVHVFKYSKALGRKEFAGN